MLSTIYRSGPTTYITLHIDENTELHQRLMGENYILLRQTYETVKDIDIGDYYLFDGTTYYVNVLPTVVKKGPTEYEHEVYFEGLQYELVKTQFLSSLSENDFYLTGTLTDFLTRIVANANRVSGGTWVVGTVTATFASEYKTLFFHGENCMQILQRLAKEYEGEFEISSRTINFVDRVENVTGESLSFGRGNGLREISRESPNDQNLITKLYAYGAEKNLNNDYRGGFRRLTLPYGKTTSFVTKNLTTYGTFEFTKYFDHIYPHFTGSVGTVGGTLKFADGTVNFNVNNYLVGGVSPKIHFNTGDLAGYEFEVSKFNNTLKSFTLLEYTDEYAKTIPNNTLNVATGNQYVILDITMPTAYVTTAESSLLIAATGFLADYAEPIVSYGLTPDWRYLKDNTLTLSLGDQVALADTDLSISATTRIVGLSRKIVKPYKYEVEVADHIVESLAQQLHSGLQDSKVKEQLESLGDIPKERWGWWMTAGEHTGRTWQTDSGLPGHNTYVKIDGKNNKLSFFVSGVEKLYIDDNIYDSKPGIYLNDGMVYNYEDDNNWLRIWAGSITAGANDTPNIANFNNTYCWSVDDTIGCIGQANVTTASAVGKNRVGLKGIANIVNASNNDNAVGVYGIAASTGTGKKYSGFFQYGDILIELGDAAGANKFFIRDSGAATVCMIDSNGLITGRGGANIGGAANYLNVGTGGNLSFAGTAQFSPPRDSGGIPEAHSDGEMWIFRDTDDGKVYLYYDDADSGVKKVELT